MTLQRLARETATIQRDLLRLDRPPLAELRVAVDRVLDGIRELQRRRATYQTEVGKLKSHSADLRQFRRELLDALPTPTKDPNDA